MTLVRKLASLLAEGRAESLVKKMVVYWKRMLLPFRDGKSKSAADSVVRSAFSPVDEMAAW